MGDKPKKKVSALGLCSGGLDSMLAGLVLREQGIRVEWVTFETPFFSAAKARKASTLTGIPLNVEPIFPVYFEMLKNPPAGYGKHMNPCMDCHTLMFRLAGEIMAARGFDFLFSGEVLGQRPMSQTRPSLRYVEKHSGLDGLIVRPLCARRLPETIPEKEGLVDRHRLLDITGRSRKRQIDLARHFGIREYPTPAGGCLLTDKGYSRRLKDLLDHQGDCTESELHLLKYGRHFRLTPEKKLIVGRRKPDNEKILKYLDPSTDTTIDVIDHPSPVGLVPGGAPDDILFLAGGICAGYSKAPNLQPVKVSVGHAGRKKTIEVIAIPPDDVKKKMI
jgi:tRNA U34 2-thiouridine synthase MnmA/TrmU